MSFKDKVVWITGSSSGIGEALAYEFDRAGSKIIISSNEDDELERVKSNCKGDVMVLPLDLMNYDELAQKGKQIIEKYGQVDILINNGGISQRSFIVDTEMNTYEKIMAIDFFGHVAVTKSVLPQMLKQKSGHIVVTSSITGKVGTPLRSGYCAAKHALHGFYDTLRAEVWRENIKVTIVCPTAVQTKISLNSVTGDGKQYGKMSDHLAKGLTPEEAAKRIIKAIEKGKEEAIIGNDSLRYAVYLKRFVPGIFSKILNKADID